MFRLTVMLGFVVMHSAQLSDVTGEFKAKQAAETEAFWARQGCQALSTEQISNEQVTAMLTKPV